MATTKDTNQFNQVLVFILWLSLIINVGDAILTLIRSVNYAEEVLVQDSFINIPLYVCSAIGCYMFLQKKATGFYIILALRIFTIGYIIHKSQNLGSSTLSPHLSELQANFLTRDIFVNIGQIIFILLIMLLRKNGKNAYQILWNK